MNPLISAAALTAILAASAGVLAITFDQNAETSSPPTTTAPTTSTTHPWYGATVNTNWYGETRGVQVGQGGMWE
jgi:hypothetical protein